MKFRFLGAIIAAGLLFALSGCEMPEPTVGKVTVTVTNPDSYAPSDLRVYFSEDSDDGEQQAEVPDTIAFPFSKSFSSGKVAERVAVTVTVRHDGAADDVYRTVFLPTEEGGDFAISLTVPPPEAAYTGGWGTEAVVGGASRAQALRIETPAQWYQVTFAAAGERRWFKVPVTSGTSYAFFQDRGALHEPMMEMFFSDSLDRFLEETPWLRTKPVFIRAYESFIWFYLHSTEAGTFRFGFQREADL